ncbi:MAG: voltage-gated potassium channel [Bradymonadia bacterium]
MGGFNGRATVAAVPSIYTHPAFVALHRAFHDPTSRAQRWIEGGIYLCIAISVAILCLELWWGPKDPTVVALQPLDIALVWIFIVEIVLRVATYRPPEVGFFVPKASRRARIEILGRLAFCFRPLVLIDIITVLAVVPALRGLRAVRLLRLLRGTKVFRYSNPFGSLARAFEENALLFGLGLSLLGASTVVGGITLFFVEHGANAKMQTMGDGIWWALVTLTTVGYGDISPVTGVGRAIGGLLMVTGLFNLALFAGIVGHALLGSVLSIREEQFRMTGYVNHLVVCGYDAGSRLVLDSLLAENMGDERIVIFANTERPPEVPSEFTWIKGEPTYEAELPKARIAYARAVVLIGSRSLLPQQADAQTILTAFTIRGYMRKHSATANRAAPLHIVAEVQDNENAEHARKAGADEVIATTRLGFNLLAHAVHEPGTGTIMSDIVSVSSHNLYVGQRPRGVATGTFGTLAAAVRKKTGALILGVRVDGEDVMNPHDGTFVPDDALLLYMAEKRVLKRS